VVRAEAVKDETNNVSPGRVWLKAVYPLVNTPPPESKALMGAAH
jgi:hypothetical protein